ncbi:MBL fold metallo-hydrolase [Cytophagaceae bacterium DM2B3-1]|uniref:MBL fold metallo-hydrolase n=1 Tax=Xanthocytophaga flava TaxID=3048013 RepID=A0ABT7CKG3_9BACT|nr:MBL fold metallo-hydrolase [Xanthocytophaga flavus]MDJ1494231.1 MBL fold metallo-hydrolase [Xanthocytophaga flavus]
MRQLYKIYVYTFFLILLCGIGWGQTRNRVTILVDAFGKSDALKQDWGFAALVEYNGKRILFDTGNDSESFAYNVKALNVDLKRLDLVVISHRHGDHTDGLHHLLKINPKVTIYTPNDEYFGGPTPPAFFRRPVDSLPVHMRYFKGKVPKQIPHGSPWKSANLVRVDSVTELMPGIRLVRNISQTKLFSETPELSLAIDTPQGQVLLVGCSHPGIETILASAGIPEKPVHAVIGGLHMVNADEKEANRLAQSLLEKWKIKHIAPGHCTGEVTFSALQQQFGKNYLYAGVGSSIDLP